MSICTYCHPSSTSFSASTRRHADSASTGFHTRTRCGPSTTKESTMSTRKFTALGLATLLLAGCGSSSLRNERDDLNAEFKDTKTAVEEAKAEKAQQRANAAETKQVLMGLDTEIRSADVTVAGKNRAVAPATRTPPTENSASGSSTGRWFKTSRLARTRTLADRLEVYTDVEAPKSMKCGASTYNAGTTVRFGRLLSTASTPAPTHHRFRRRSWRQMRDQHRALACRERRTVRLNETDIALERRHREAARSGSRVHHRHRNHKVNFSRSRKMHRTFPSEFARTSTIPSSTPATTAKTPDKKPRQNGGNP